jgi:hypothetical protein
VKSKSFGLINVALIEKIYHIQQLKADNESLTSEDEKEVEL